MVDDLGWGDPGFNGNTDIQTPNMDQLASSGIIFNRFYSASPVCSPTRASCLTGRNPYRMGIPNANSGFLPKSETTIAELLKNEGYVTGHFGKWHLGTFTNQIKDANRGKPGDSSHLSVPSDHGFDTFFSTESKVPTWNPMEKPLEFDEEAGESLRYGWMARNTDVSELYGTRYWTGRNEEVKGQLDGNDTEIIMDQAMEFISQSTRNKETFFAAIWTHTPHLPVVIDEEYALKYPNEDFANQLYYGSITALDDQIGRLWNQLDSLNIKDNTCIFFCSDNGPEVRTPGSAGPFRGKKRDLYEGGIRVPAFCVWPKGIQAGLEIDFPSVTSDYLPTVLEILNLQNPENIILDGISLFPAIQGTVNERTSPIGFRYPGKMSWVTQTHKLISTDNGETFELYNLQSDPGEQTNIIIENPELTDSLQHSLQNWLNDISNSTYHNISKK
ncbi:MAG: sulfatase-like hydrolase/transferase [Bacteroidales bacterium]|nr:sulfatase-like hydrolase/transferase [Bacteroidales bacterium]